MSGVESTTLGKHGAPLMKLGAFGGQSKTVSVMQYYLKVLGRIRIATLLLSRKCLLRLQGIHSTLCLRPGNYL